MKRLIGQGYFLTLSSMALAALVCVVPGRLAAQNKRSWSAPPEVKKLKNPAAASNATVEQGRKNFRQYCVDCHGAKGDGKGAMAGSLKRKPADLTTRNFRGLSDGEIFWRISKGDDVMPSFEKTFPLSDMERWQLVRYLRSLAEKP